ncbi:MAG: zinc-binding dehydrogenase, partial [Roseicyclus sp.]
VPQFPANHLLVKNIDVIGFYWGGYMRFDARALGDSLAELMHMYEAGRIRPHIGATRPLEQFGEAFALLKNRSVAGKVIVSMSDQDRIV